MSTWLASCGVATEPSRLRAASCSHTAFEELDSGVCSNYTVHVSGLRNKLAGYMVGTSHDSNVQRNACHARQQQGEAWQSCDSGAGERGGVDAERP
jgi:hypothetical protein